MPSVEKISIALPPKMVAAMRQAIHSGEYASSSEVVRDALRDWSLKRTLRQQSIKELRRLWRQAIVDPAPGLAAEDVLDHLEHKYQPRAKSGTASR